MTENQILRQPVTVLLRNLGTEEFEYPSMEQALKGVRNLYPQAKYHREKDGFSREIVIQVL